MRIKCLESGSLCADKADKYAFMVASISLRERGFARVNTWFPAFRPPFPNVFLVVVISISVNIFYLCVGLVVEKTHAYHADPSQHYEGRGRDGLVLHVQRPQDEGLHGEQLQVSDRLPRRRPGPRPGPLDFGKACGLFVVVVVVVDVTDVIDTVLSSSGLLWVFASSVMTHSNLFSSTTHRRPLHRMFFAVIGVSPPHPLFFFFFLSLALKHHTNSGFTRPPRVRLDRPVTYSMHLYTYLFPPPPHAIGSSWHASVLSVRQLYHQSPVLMLQQLVDNWIMLLEGSSAVTPPVVRITEFPSPGYETDGFWAQVNDD